MSVKERARHKRIREYVINRDGSICCYCDMPLAADQVTLEHIIPDSKRGTFNSTNLTIACYECNNRRGNKPFFEYCKQFEWSDEKLEKYQRMSFNNLKIKVLNVAKEECLQEEEVIPNNLIKKACKVLKIKSMDFSDYEKIYQFEIKFDEPCERKKIKFSFEQLIRIIEADSE
jgi:hypothetical protein